MTQQMMFGGPWTQTKLQVLSKYLRAYRQIFRRNVRANYFKITYVDAFAGTGVVPRPDVQGFAGLIPELAVAEEEFRKGSVKRALEVEPPFDHYVFIEKDTGKCEELAELSRSYPNRQIVIINEDANAALLNWCEEMDTKRERAVVFLDPFGASVDWKVIEAIANTKAVDLWILFPYGTVNRMLVNNRKPPKEWADTLTRIFGTGEWEQEFYSTALHTSILNPEQEVEQIYKTANKESITDFFLKRLGSIFAAVAEPGYLYNSKGLLFVLFFAAANAKGAPTAVRIANDVMRDI